ncbi:MAG: LemA family protein [Firmicutes bacterium]|nr:LemA family protein [Bacillota bacterium]
MRKVGLLVVLIIVLLVIFVGGSYISISNAIIRSDEDVRASWAEVENQLQRRYDLIPNLVETVKGYAAHESAVFQAVADARARLGGARSMSEKIEASNALEGALGRLLVVVENYPELKADASFRQLMDELAGTENRIAVARGRYNEKVRAFNVKIRVFPNSIVSGMKGITPHMLFEAQEGARTAPQVKF